MRLVIDGRRLTAGRTGVGRYLEGLLEEWGRGGLPHPETVVVLKDRAGLDRVPRAEGLRAVVVGERWPGLVWERWGLGRVLRPGDLLFAPTNLVPATWKGRTVLVMFDTLQEVLPDGFPWHVRMRFGGRYRQAARRAERVLVPSEATARDVRRIYGVPADRLRVVLPGIGPEFRPLPSDSTEVIEARRTLGLGEGPFFLFVGKRSRRRNIPAILTAFAQHRAESPTHRLVFVGPEPPGPDLGPLTPDRGLVVAGHVAEPILRGLMADAVALLYPSDYEGFGLPVVEALASGCPVVTLRKSALVESGGDAAYYLDAPDPAGLALALRDLATDPDARAERIARGLAHASRFRREAFAQAIKAELQEAAQGCGPGSAGKLARTVRRRPSSKSISGS